MGSENLTKKEFDTLLDTTFDEIKKLDIPNEFNVGDDTDDTEDDIPANKIIDHFNDRLSPYQGIITKNKYPLGLSIKNQIYKLILLDSDDDVPSMRKLLIMFAFYQYFSNPTTPDGNILKEQYNKSLINKVITLDLAKIVVIFYIKSLDIDEAVRMTDNDFKSIVNKWLESDSEMNRVDGGGNNKNRSSRKKHKSIKKLKRKRNNRKSKKSKQV